MKKSLAVAVLALAACGGEEPHQGEECWDEVRMASGATVCIPPPWTADLIGMCMYVEPQSSATGRLCQDDFDAEACEAVVELSMLRHQRDNHWVARCICREVADDPSCNGEPWYTPTE